MRSVPERLPAATARRIALAAQGFAGRRPSGRVDLRHVRAALARVTIVQIDSVNVLVRSHELPLLSRIGPYPRGVLTTLADRRRELFEYWAHEASFVPVALHPVLRWRMAAAEGHAWGRMVRMYKEFPGYVARVLDEVRDRGPIAASELSEPGRKQGAWWGWGEGKAALEWLMWSGQIVVAGRGTNFERRYDLPHRVLPAEVLAAPTPSVEDAHRELLRLAARSHGVGTARDLADYFRLKMPDARPRLAELVEDGSLVPVTVDGWREPAYLDPAARIPRRVDRRALLSPFDSLVWERARTERLFGMRYRIEIYTPAPKRVHGYYVLPFLLGDQLVARVDLKSDRGASVLRARRVTIEDDQLHRANEIMGELTEELTVMASWLGLDSVDVPRRS